MAGARVAADELRAAGDDVTVVGLTVEAVEAGGSPHLGPRFAERSRPPARGH